MRSTVFPLIPPDHSRSFLTLNCDSPRLAEAALAFLVIAETLTRRNRRYDGKPSLVLSPFMSEQERLKIETNYLLGMLDDPPRVAGPLQPLIDWIEYGVVPADEHFKDEVPMEELSQLPSSQEMTAFHNLPGGETTVTYCRRLCNLHEILPLLASWLDEIDHTLTATLFLEEPPLQVAGVAEKWLVARGKVSGLPVHSPKSAAVMASVEFSYPSPSQNS